MKRLFLAFLAVFLACFDQAQAATYPWGPWTKYSGNPVLDDYCIFPESILSDVNDPLRQPILIAHPTRGTKYYWMYYDTCYRGGGRLAYSSDLIHWTVYEGNPVVSPFLGEVTLFIGHMFRDNDKFYVFYDITAGNNGGTGYVITYAYANSPFGPWSKGSEVLRFGLPGTWDEGRVTESFITKYNGMYYMYYMGDLMQPFGRGEQVGVAVTEAVNFPKGPWVKKGLMLPIHQDTTSWDRGLTADPSVIQVGDKFYMQYTGSTGGSYWRVGMAWADNPLGPWNTPNYPTFYPESTWENYSILRGSLHYFNNKFYSTYAASDGSVFRGGVATASSLTLNTPTPVPTSTPILDVSPTPTVTLVPTPTPAATIKTAEFFVTTGSDDAYQQSATVYLTNSQIKMGWYDPYVGFRVTGGGLADLKGKTILNASLGFSSAVNSNSNITQRIYLELSDNCASFSTASNNIGARQLTTKSKLWNVGTSSWVVNSRYFSPDISGAVSEVVNRPGWNGNSLCVVFKNEGSGSYAERYIFAKESGQKAASLKVTYSDGEGPVSTPSPTALPTQTPSPTPAVTTIPTTTPTATPGLPASCTGMGLSNRAPAVNTTINPSGIAKDGTGENKIVSYLFDFGDGTNTGWKTVSLWSGSVSASKSYSKTGSFLIQFKIKLQNGQILGGAGTQCAVGVSVN